MRSPKIGLDIDRPAPRHPFTLMAKPAGSKCNLDCKYCYYLEKEKLYPSRASLIMPDSVLESYVRQFIESQDSAEVTFIWHGGEPTLLGIDFYSRALRFQRQYANGKRIANSLQTNGVLIDASWAEFFRANEFLIGLSVDGPIDLHDAYRKDKRYRPTFDQVMRGWDALRLAEVEVNLLTTVNRLNGSHPVEVYEFLKSIGGEFIQFIPVVERLGEPTSSSEGDEAQVTDWSVLPEQYGEFLVTIYDRWLATDVGHVFVQLFDLCLNVWSGRPPTLCWFARDCGQALAIEHNGDLFSCDHYVYPEFKLGNIVEAPLGKLARSKQQLDFGRSKSNTLPQYCRQCEVRFVCNGECPKRRFLTTPDGESGLNYLCKGYKRFFTHVDPSMRQMARLISRGRSPREIMTITSS